MEQSEIDAVEILKIGKIQNEIECDMAILVDKKLRLLSREDLKYKVIRKKLRDLIEEYEKINY